MRRPKQMYPLTITPSWHCYKKRSVPPPPTLDTLNGKVLAEIFEFLDAVEILNTAQINITMYSRVDALFGLSGQAAGE